MIEDRQAEILEILYSPGEWFQVPYKMLRLVSPNEAVLFSYLVGMSRRFKARTKGGWFHRKVKDVQQDIGMSEDQQKTAIKKLKARGWLQTDRKGLPAVRCFQLNLLKVSEEIVELDDSDPELDRGKIPELESGKSPGTDRGKIPDHNRESSRERKEKRDLSLSGLGPDGQNGSVKPSRKKPNLRDKMDTRDFRRIVSKHIKVNGKANMRDWENQFRLMRERDGVPPEDIRAALEWYDEYIGEEYIPEAFSAKSFREKYANGKIPAAMKRTRTQPVKKDSQGRTSDEIERDHVYATLMNRQEGRMRKPSREELDEVLDELGIARSKYETYQMV